VNSNIPRAHAVAAVMLLLVVNLVILMIMVIAPSHSAPVQAALTYKLTNFALALLALIVAFWRRWFAFLTIFAVLQIVSLFFFLPYVNSLPM
jgi:hypothetical protein